MILRFACDTKSLGDTTLHMQAMSQSRNTCMRYNKLLNLQKKYMKFGYDVREWLDEICATMVKSYITRSLKINESRRKICIYVYKIRRWILHRPKWVLVVNFSPATLQRWQVMGYVVSIMIYVEAFDRPNVGLMPTFGTSNIWQANIWQNQKVPKVGNHFRDGPTNWYPIL